jgi:uncharacterized protein (DUF433 family)
VRFERITVNPEQMGGLPCIRGLRIPVTTILGQLAAGRTHDEILTDFPDLEDADIDADIEYAAEAPKSGSSLSSGEASRRPRRLASRGNHAG